MPFYILLVLVLLKVNGAVDWSWTWTILPAVFVYVLYFGWGARKGFIEGRKK